MSARLDRARFEALGPTLLYRILQLRAAVFVVEQACPYQDLDGRDLEPGTWHCWIEDGEEVVAYLRILEEREGSRVGRVVTAPASRGSGLAAALVRDALALAPDPVRASAQSHLEGWYERLGFAVAGEEFVEDGIPHLPMLLVAR